MNIIIVGGGTAGWISAFILSKKSVGHTITVIESSKVPNIGVGEGVTGKLTDFFEDPELGLDEFEFIQETWALPKYGIKFSNWKEKGQSFFSPIEGSITEALNFDVFLYNSIYRGHDTSLASFSGNFYLENKIPWKRDGENLHWMGGKAYHIDAIKVGEYFKKKAIDSGVTHIDAKIEQVLVNSDKINSLVLDTGETVAAEFFIDCSGFARILMSKLDNPWVSYTDRLIVDGGMVFKLENDDCKKESYTHANAQNSGWIFEIPTRHKIGRGYIFSSSFTSEDKMIEELELEYGQKIESVKTIKFGAGRFEKSWHSNCLATGLCSSFIEPLQATSLHVTITQIMKFARDCIQPTLTETIDTHSINSFNRFFERMYSDLVDFIQVTYMGGRTDTDFWKYMTYDSIKSDKLNEILHLAKHRLTRYGDFDQYEGFAGQGLWNYTLAGLGYFDKEVIEKTFESHNIDINQVNADWIKYYVDLKRKIPEAISAQELNDFLVEKGDLKFKKIIY
jgi:hypothetical protein